MRYQNNFVKKEFPYKDVILKDNVGFTSHCHKEVEIIHIIEGSLKILFNDNINVLNKNDIVIIPPYINHTILPPNMYCERLVILIDIKMNEYLFDNNYSNYLCNEKSLLNVQTINYFWNNQTQIKIKNLIYDMHREYLDKEEAWEFSIKLLSDTLLLTAIREFPTLENNHMVSDSVFNKMQIAITYIADNFADFISLEECAKLCNFNDTYFSKYFKKHMGITFQEYVKNTRIEHAKWLLLTSSDSITNISNKCGFSDIRIFNKIFKQQIGETASSYRKNNKIV